MSWLRKIFFRLEPFFRRKRIEGELSEELQAHLEMATEANIAAGMPPEAARYAAQRELGGIEQVKESYRDERGLPWLEHLLQDLRFAARWLRKSPAFTTVAVLSLAIGIGLNAAVFSIINAIFYQSIRGVPEPHCIVFFNDLGVSRDGAERIREEVTAVVAITTARGISATIAVDAFEHRDNVALVAADYFDVFGAKPALGRLFSAPERSQRGDAQPVAVLNHAFWENYLDRDPAVIGRIARINGVSFTIIGVAAPEFHGPGPVGPPLWVPADFARSVERRKAGDKAERFALFGRLRPGVSLAQAQATIDVVIARSPVVFGEKARVRLSQGREDWRGEISAEKRVEGILVTTVPLLIVGGLLWIACSNVANLLLARAVQRQKEIAIRVAGGATRSRLVRMLMAESLLLAGLGGAAGLWVSHAAIRFVFATLSNFALFSVQLDIRVLLYTTGVCFLAALLFGLVPALQASKVDVNAALKGESANPRFRGSRLRAFFLASQIASSVALLVVAGTFVKSLVMAAHVGAAARQMDHLLIAQLSGGERVGFERETFYRDAVERMRSVPGVEAAALFEAGNTTRGRFSRPGDTAIESAPPVEIELQRIESAFFGVLEIALQRGTAFSSFAPGGVTHEAIVNEAMARKFWSVDTTVGQQFQLDQQSYTVIGVVNDRGAQPKIYTPLALAGAERVGLFVRTRGAASDMTVAVSAALRSLAPGANAPAASPYREVAFRTMSELTRLAVFIGALAVALAAAGIYASLAFSASQRTREIGVRMALGATRFSVLKLVLRSGLGVAAWGSGIGLVLALIGVRLLFGLMTGQSGIDPVAIAAVMLFFSLIATLACALPAYRATRVDAMVALRCE
jgi:predicted permease